MDMQDDDGDEKTLPKRCPELFSISIVWLGSGDFIKHMGEDIYNSWTCKVSNLWKVWDHRWDLKGQF